MIERVNAPLPREAEPALTFTVEQGEGVWRMAQAYLRAVRP